MISNHFWWFKILEHCFSALQFLCVFTIFILQILCDFMFFYVLNLDFYVLFFADEFFLITKRDNLGWCVILGIMLLFCLCVWTMIDVSVDMMAHDICNLINLKPTLYFHRCNTSPHAPSSVQTNCGLVYKPAHNIYNLVYALVSKDPTRLVWLEAIPAVCQYQSGRDLSCIKFSDWCQY